MKYLILGILFSLFCSNSLLARGEGEANTLTKIFADDAYNTNVDTADVTLRGLRFPHDGYWTCRIDLYVGNNQNNATSLEWARITFKKEGQTGILGAVLRQCTIPNPTSNNEFCAMTATYSGYFMKNEIINAVAVASTGTVMQAVRGYFDCEKEG